MCSSTERPIRGLNSLQYVLHICEKETERSDLRTNFDDSHTGSTGSHEHSKTIGLGMFVEYPNIACLYHSYLFEF